MFSVGADGSGRLGTARVMSHDAIVICPEVRDFSLGYAGGPNARTRSPHSLSSPGLPGGSLS